MFKASTKLKGIEISEIRQMNARANKETINLGIGQLHLEPPQPLVSAGVEAFKNNLKYTPNAGLLELRDLVATEHSNYTGKTFTHDNVVITSGVEHALYNAITTLVNKGDEVLVPEIAFPVYGAITSMNYGKVVTYKMDDDFSIDTEDLRSKLTKKTKIVVVNTIA